MVTELEAAAKLTPRAGPRLRFTPGRWLLYAGLLFWSSIGLFALGWIVMTAFKTNRELFANVWALPTGLEWANFARAWERARLGELFLNSLYVIGVTVPATALMGCMAAYVLARFTFKGGSALLLYFIGGTSIPLQLISVPLFLLFHQLDLLNSLTGLILVYIAVHLPFTVFVLTGFYKSLPVELEEAALIDGASPHGVFWRVALPLTAPGIATVSIFNALGVWNEFLIALMLISDRSKATIPLGIYNLKVTQDYAADWVGLMAGLVLVLIPSLIIFLLLQRQIARVVTLGALKG